MIAGRAWRLFRVGSVGGLYPPFGYGRDRVSRTWVRAKCIRTDHPLAATLALVGLTATLYERRPHTSPDATCGCGWRVYPDLDAAVRGAQEMPTSVVTQLEGLADLVLVGVEYGGTTLGQATLNVPEWQQQALAAEMGVAAQDAWMQDQAERHTLRAEWIRVSGPIFVGSNASPEVGRCLRDRHRTRVIVLEQPLYPALASAAVVTAQAR